jgi:hypothetical protein
MTPGVEQVLQVSDHRGLDLPKVKRALLDRLVGNPRFQINEPVQDRCPNVLFVFIHVVESTLANIGEGSMPFHVLRFEDSTQPTMVVPA